jgi:Skp family chaperone for outer membrane proteins
VKKTLILLVGVSALGVLAYLGNRSAVRAQGGAPALQSRIAIINLSQAIKKYKKWTAFEGVYKQKYETFNLEFEKRKKEYTILKTDLDKFKDDANKVDAIKRKMRELDREVADIGEEAKKQLSQLEEGQAVEIYQEVQKAVEAFARANGIELVLQYNDAPPTVAAEYWHPANVVRKLKSQPCIPIWFTPNLDITEIVASMLNQHLDSLTPQAQTRPAGQQ